MNRIYGAFPPPNREWMLDKSVAEIDAILEESEETNKTPEEVLQSEEWKKRIKENNSII